MTDMAQDQRNFMYMGNQTTTVHNLPQIELYLKLIQEEFLELMFPSLDKILLNKLKETFENYKDGMIYHNTVDINAEYLKEAIDLLVVTLGFIYSLGINPNDVWNLVHANNMAKVNETVIKDENGKIMKSPESIARKEKLMESIRKLL